MNTIRQFAGELYFSDTNYRDPINVVAFIIEYSQDSKILSISFDLIAHWDDIGRYRVAGKAQKMRNRYESELIRSRCVRTNQDSRLCKQLFHEIFDDDGYLHVKASWNEDASQFSYEGDLEEIV